MAKSLECVNNRIETEGCAPGGPGQGHGGIIPVIQAGRAVVDPGDKEHCPDLDTAV